MYASVFGAPSTNSAKSVVSEWLSSRVFTMPQTSMNPTPADVLLGLLDEVVQERHPEGRGLQAQGQWFQLLALAEQYAAHRARRRVPEAGGTFHRVIKEAKE